MQMLICGFQTKKKLYKKDWIIASKYLFMWEVHIILKQILEKKIHANDVALLIKKIKFLSYHICHHYEFSLLSFLHWSFSVFII